GDGGDFDGPDGGQRDHRRHVDQHPRNIDFRPFRTGSEPDADGDFRRDRFGHLGCDRYGEQPHRRFDAGRAVVGNDHHEPDQHEHGGGHRRRDAGHHGNHDPHPHRQRHNRFLQPPRNIHFRHHARPVWHHGARSSAFWRQHYSRFLPQFHP